MRETVDEGVDFHGPCCHCGRDLWLILEDRLPAESLTTVHGYKLPDGLGWFAVADDTGWSACPLCGWAIPAATVSLN